MRIRIQRYNMKEKVEFNQQIFGFLFEPKKVVYQGLDIALKIFFLDF